MCVQWADKPAGGGGHGPGRQDHHHRVAGTLAEVGQRQCHNHHRVAGTLAEVGQRQCHNHHRVAGTLAEVGQRHRACEALFPLYIDPDFKKVMSTGTA